MFERIIKIQIKNKLLAENNYLPETFQQTFSSSNKESTGRRRQSPDKRII